MRGTAIENKLLSDIIAASIYVCSVLAMMGFVFGLSLQGVLATSGIIAIVLGLALQSTLGDVFSGLSLSIEKPYRIGDEILAGQFTDAGKHGCVGALSQQNRAVLEQSTALFALGAADHFRRAAKQIAGCLM